MKATLTSARRFALLLSIAAIVSLTNPSVQAQTFTGKPVLTQEPAQLRAIVTTVPNSSVLRVRFENDGYGSVRIQVRDKRGAVLYDEQQPKRKWAGQLDLASLPKGDYTLLLQTPDTKHTEYIHINAPESGYLVWVTSEPTATPVAQQVERKKLVARPAKEQ